MWAFNPGYARVSNTSTYSMYVTTLFFAAPPFHRISFIALLLQALGDRMCIILAQSMSPTRQFTASLTVSLWALAKLSWAPTLPQAQVLVRLLAQALTSGRFLPWLSFVSVLLQVGYALEVMCV
jgi:hypothetical protein